MSASEKLKALETRLLPVTGTDIPGRGDLASLRYALPQIRALVEAVESLTSFDPSAWHGSRLVHALAALDEALGDSS